MHLIILTWCKVQLVTLLRSLLLRAFIEVRFITMNNAEMLFGNVKFNLSVIFAGRKKKRGHGWLLMAGAVLAGMFFLENLEISQSEDVKVRKENLTLELSTINDLFYLFLPERSKLGFWNRFLKKFLEQIFIDLFSFVRIQLEIEKCTVTNLNYC